MPPFKSPTPRYRPLVAAEKRALTRHFAKRGVPRATRGRLLLASWNVANLGAQKRTDSALQLIAHIMKRFELIAVQEVSEHFRTFEKVVELMGPRFDYVMTDTAGNRERLAYVYDTKKVRPLNLFGELALRQREFPKRTVKVRYRKNRQDKIDTFKNHRFIPFDRNPFIGSFSAGSIDFTLVNVHLYFGKFQNSKKRSDRERYARRVLEIYALSRWADRRVNRAATYDHDIILLGDMNVPKMDKDESTYKALLKSGFRPLEYGAKADSEYGSKTGGSNLGNDKTYDQIALAPGSIRRRIIGHDIFDFDNAIFRSLWDRLTVGKTPRQARGLFNRHVKHHISDHRPFWVELDTTRSG